MSCASWCFGCMVCPHHQWVRSWAGISKISSVLFFARKPFDHALWARHSQNHSVSDAVSQPTTVRAPCLGLCLVTADVLFLAHFFNPARVVLLAWLSLESFPLLGSLQASLTVSPFCHDVFFLGVFSVCLIFGRWGKINTLYGNWLDHEALKREQLSTDEEKEQNTSNRKKTFKRTSGIFGGWPMEPEKC